MRWCGGWHLYALPLSFGYVHTAFRRIYGTWKKHSCFFFCGNRHFFHCYVGELVEMYIFLQIGKIPRVWFIYHHASLRGVAGRVDGERADMAAYFNNGVMWLDFK